MLGLLSLWPPPKSTKVISCDCHCLQNRKNKVLVVWGPTNQQIKLLSTADEIIQIKFLSTTGFASMTQCYKLFGVLSPMTIWKSKLKKKGNFLTMLALSYVISSVTYHWFHELTPNILIQCFSDVNVPIGHLGILLKSNFDLGELG